jgi:hypothetical protein
MAAPDAVALLAQFLSQADDLIRSRLAGRQIEVPHLVVVALTPDGQVV